jgi:hypothetical protein
MLMTLWNLSEMENQNGFASWLNVLKLSVPYRIKLTNSFETLIACALLYIEIVDYENVGVKHFHDTSFVEKVREFYDGLLLRKWKKSDEAEVGNPRLLESDPEQ